MAQETEKPKKLILRGYIKDMLSLSYLGDSSLYQNLVHNRLNFAWYASPSLTLYAEFRNRLITGDYVKKIPNYGQLIGYSDEYLDLSANLISSGSTIFNTAADRLYVQWSKDNWEIRAGRQRINWGVNLAWNPNDWFNAYSFFDFDYEERPGSDALRIIHYTGPASSLEVAAKMANDIDHFVGAAMWKVNRWDYDIQFLAGMVQGDMGMGAGWAGRLGNAGFKGEFSYFHKVVETAVNKNYTNMFLGAISADYSFPNSLYLNGSVMFNSEGLLHPGFGSIVFGLQPGTVRSLSPYKWSSFLQAGYQINPLLNSGLAVIGYPGSDSFFLNPSLTLSVLQNLDLDIVGQLFYGTDGQSDFGSLFRAFYLRLKWSF